MTKVRGQPTRETEHTEPGEYVLEVEDLGVTYRSGAVGVNGITFRIRRGTVTALVGPNGGGKTSTLRAIGGFLRREPVTARSEGLTFLGADIRALHPRVRARQGLQFVPEDRKIFSSLTVREQLTLSWASRKRGRFDDVLERWLTVFPAMSVHLDRRGGYLSGGQRQMLGILAALCASPELLMVDEVTLGLSPAVTQDIGRSLAELSRGGMTLLIADQNSSMAFELANEILILEAGHPVAQGSPDVLRRDPILRKAYLGIASLDEAVVLSAKIQRVYQVDPDTSRDSEAGRGDLSIQTVTMEFQGLVALNDVTARFAGDETIGLVGPNGSGKTTLLNIISRIYNQSRGHVELDGRSIDRLKPHAVARLGVSRTFQHIELPPAMTALSAVLLGLHTKIGAGAGLYACGLPFLRGQEERSVERALNSLAKVGLSKLATKQLGELPYGLAKRVDLARALAGDPRILSWTSQLPD